MPVLPAAVRRVRRPLVVVTAALVALGLLLTLVSVGLGLRIDHRVGQAVQCRLPAGVTVTDVDVHGNPLLVAATRESDGVDLALAAELDAVERLLGRSAPPGRPTPQLSTTDGLLGLSLPRLDRGVTVVLQPSVADGALRLSPDSVRWGDQIFAPSLVAGLAGGVPGGLPVELPVELPVRDLPDGVRLVDVRVGDGVLDVELAVAGSAASRLAADSPARCS
jgi:hypothetical protein